MKSEPCALGELKEPKELFETGDPHEQEKA
jgi:hypothetical protein